MANKPTSALTASLSDPPPVQQAITSITGSRAPEPRREALAYEVYRASFSNPGLLSASYNEGLLADVAGSMPASPYISHLHQIPKPRLIDNSEAGQKLRRSLLRGAVIVFVTAGYSGKRFIFEKAKQLGVRTVILESADSWSQVLESEGVIEKFVAVDMDDPTTVFDGMVRAIQAVSQQLGQVDGVVTFCEMAVPLTSRLAEVLGLPGNPTTSVETCRSKFDCRAKLEEGGLPTPKYFLISDVAALPAAAAHVGFPAVIKPINGAASLGVVRVDDAEALSIAYARVLKELAGMRISSGALTSGEEGDAEGNAGGWISFDVMMEEYLDGDEVDCDIILSDGKAVYGAVTDNWPTVEPYFNETGSNCPSILPAAAQRELLTLSVNSLKALNFVMGVFHVEAKWTSRGARLIEINCRMGGGPVRDTNLLVWGVDLVEEQLMGATGIPVRPQIAPAPLRCLAEYSLNSARSGVITSTTFMDAWASHADVLYARPLVGVGDKVVCVADGLPTWVGEVMVEKPTVEEAIAFVKEIADAVVVPFA